MPALNYRHSRHRRRKYLDAAIKARRLYDIHSVIREMKNVAIWFIKDQPFFC